MHPQACRPDRKAYIRGQGSERYIRKLKQTEENDDCPSLPTQPTCNNGEGQARGTGRMEPCSAMSQWGCLGVQVTECKRRPSGDMDGKVSSIWFAHRMGVWWHWEGHPEQQLWRGSPSTPCRQWASMRSPEYKYVLILMHSRPAPTPVILPGKPHGQRSLAGCSLWDHKSQTWLSN